METTIAAAEAFMLLNEARQKLSIAEAANKALDGFVLLCKDKISKIHEHERTLLNDDILRERVLVQRELAADMRERETKLDERALVQRELAASMRERETKIETNVRNLVEICNSLMQDQVDGSTTYTAVQKIRADLCNSNF